MQLRVSAPRICIVNTKPGVLEPAVQFVAKCAQAAGAVVGVESNNDLEAAMRADSVDAVIGIGGTGSGTTRPLGDRAVAHRQASLSRHRTCAGGNVQPSVMSTGARFCSSPAGSMPRSPRWLVLGRALIARLAGVAHRRDAVSSVRLARKVTSTIGIAEFVPLRLSEEGAKPLGSGFLSLQSLAQADGWMLVPAESEGYPAGTEVTMRPLP